LIIEKLKIYCWFTRKPIFTKSLCST